MNRYDVYNLIFIIALGIFIIQKRPIEPLRLTDKVPLKTFTAIG
jgi:hypothetical protein